MLILYLMTIITNNLMQFRSQLIQITATAVANYQPCPTNRWKGRIPSERQSPIQMRCEFCGG